MYYEDAASASGTAWIADAIPEAGHASVDVQPNTPEITQTDEDTPTFCEPLCGNKQCGDDGCGGSCGTCAYEHSCSCDGIMESCATLTGACDEAGQCVVVETNTVCDDEKFCTHNLCMQNAGCLFVEKADCCVTVEDCKVYEGPDYAGTCENNYCIPPKTCAGQCGYTFSGGIPDCYCDEMCFIFKDCCPHICSETECAGYYAKECAESDQF